MRSDVLIAKQAIMIQRAEFISNNSATCASRFRVSRLTDFDRHNPGHRTKVPAEALGNGKLCVAASKLRRLNFGKVRGREPGPMILKMPQVLDTRDEIDIQARGNTEADVGLDRGAIELRKCCWSLRLRPQLRKAKARDHRERQKVPKAPIGHRQPRADQVPSGKTFANPNDASDKPSSTRR